MLASDILTSVKLYGFDDLSNTEFLSVLNDVYHDFNNLESWPYLQKLVTGTSTSGNGQLFASTLDIKQVLSLVNTTQGYALTPVDADTFYKDFASMSTAIGYPAVYYLTTVDAVAPNGWNIFTWSIPNNSTDSYQLRYLYIAPDLALSDTPVIPARYHRILVYAVLAELYDQEDDMDAAMRMQGKYDRRLARIRDDLWSRQYDRDDTMQNLDENYGEGDPTLGWY